MIIPFPIPLMKKGDAWRFDTEAGRTEVLYRRIGGNELDTIQACLAYVDAQNEYADKDHGEGVGVYAQRIISQPGKKDGLYWPAGGRRRGKPARRAHRGGDRRRAIAPAAAASARRSTATITSSLPGRVRPPRAACWTTW